MWRVLDTAAKLTPEQRALELNQLVYDTDSIQDPGAESYYDFMTPALRRHKAYSWRLTPVPCSAHKN